MINIDKYIERESSLSSEYFSNYMFVRENLSNLYCVDSLREWVEMTDEGLLYDGLSSASMDISMVMMWIHLFKKDISALTEKSREYISTHHLPSNEELEEFFINLSRILIIYDLEKDNYDM